ncbi:MAG TPA: serine/threonine-protein kinase [Herpetosiphonaceae bacterium]
MLAPNTVLQNRYVIVRQIGEGGFGAVYEAQDQRLRNTVALKQLLFDDERLAKIFQREAQLLASLSHPALPRVIDHFAEGDGQYLVMDYVAGEDLAATLQRRGGALPLADALRWTRQLLEVVGYLHECDPPVLHRDIKPANIKINGKGNLLLLDFGLAKGTVATQIDPGLTSVRGYTPKYAPPEQIQGDGTSQRSDLYSIASTAYHLLTGQPPADAIRRATALASQKPDPLEPPRALNPEIPTAVNDALVRALAIDPQNRPPSAADMLAALDGAAVAEPPAAAAQPVPTKVLRRRPGKAWWALGGAALLAIVAAALFASGILRPESAAQTPAAPAVAGKVTIWHAYYTGNTAQPGLDEMIERARQQFPQVTIEVEAVPFGEVFQRFESDALIGQGPDLLLVVNERLGDLARRGLLLPLDEGVAGRLPEAAANASEGMRVDGKLYGVPEAYKAAALYYNPATVPSPPVSTDALLADLAAGKKLAVDKNVYFSYGFLQGFGAKLFNPDNTCAATIGGPQTLQYLENLRDAGAVFAADGAEADALFKSGQADMIINGPWALVDYRESLGADKIGVAPLPAGPRGNAGPLTDINGFVINAKSKNPAGALELALFLASPEAQSVYAAKDGHIPVALGAQIDDPALKALVRAAQSGVPRPQAAEFNQFWDPFNQAMGDVLDRGVAPEQAVAAACETLDRNNNKR